MKSAGECWLESACGAGGCTQEQVLSVLTRFAYRDNHYFDSGKGVLEFLRTTKNSPLATEQLRQRALAAAKAATAVEVVTATAVVTAAEVVIAIPVASVWEVPQHPTRTKYEDMRLDQQMQLAQKEQDRLDQEAEDRRDHFTSDFTSDRGLDLEDIHTTITSEIEIHLPRCWFF